MLAPDPCRLHFMTRQSVYFPPTPEPGKDRAAYSGSDGVRPSVETVLFEARAALESGDIKTAHTQIESVMRYYSANGRGIGLPAEAPEMKALAEARFHTGRGLEEERFLGRASGRHADNALVHLWRAIEARESFTR